LSQSQICFLTARGRHLFISDIKLNQVYVVDMKNDRSRTFGGPGRAEGRFNDAAGVAVDDRGWTVVADAGNHRLQVFNRQRRYECAVSVDQPLRRPSGICLDTTGTEPALFVLNLKSNTLVKFVLKR